MLIGLAFAQGSKLPNIALIPFTGDEHISKEQLDFITGRFAAELVQTKAFNVLERSRMEFILKEQGFQESGVCNSAECHVHVGQLLGVDNMVAGSIVQFGPTFMMRLDYLDVGTGAILNSVDLQMEGELHEVVDFLCQHGSASLAEKVMGTKDAKPIISKPASIPTEIKLPQSSHLSWKRKIALGIVGIAGLEVLGGVSHDDDISKNEINYRAAWADGNYSAAVTAYDNVKHAESKRNEDYYAALGTALVGMVLWFWPEGGSK